MGLNYTLSHMGPTVPKPHIDQLTVAHNLFETWVPSFFSTSYILVI